MLARKRRVARVGAWAAAVTIGAACALAPAAGAAVTLEGAVSDTVAGTSVVPAGVVFQAFVDTDGRTPAPASIRFALGTGLGIYPTATACDLAVITDRPTACPADSSIGAGEINTTSATFVFGLYAASGGGLAARITSVITGESVAVAPIAVDTVARTMTLALPAALQGQSLRSIALRLGEGNPALDWIKSTQCPGSSWPIQAEFLNAQGAVTSTVKARVGCRPPRRAGIGRLAPQLLLVQRVTNGRKTTRVSTVTLAPGLPANATMHVICRVGCRGRWRQRVNPAGPTKVTLKPGIIATTSGLRIEVAVASPSVRGSYLVFALNRNADGQITGWAPIARGCLRLGQAPTRAACLR